MKKYLFVILVIIVSTFILNIEVSAEEQGVCVKWKVSPVQQVTTGSKSKVGIECGKEIKKMSDFKDRCWIKIKRKNFDIYTTRADCIKSDPVDTTYNCSQHTKKRQCNKKSGGNCEWDASKGVCVNRGTSTPSYMADHNDNYEDEVGCSSMSFAECNNHTATCKWDASVNPPKCYNKVAYESAPTPGSNGEGGSGEGSVDDNDSEDLHQLDVSCESVFAGFEEDLQEVMNAFRIIGPVLVGIFTVLEYVKALVQKDADALGKANKRLLKRLFLIVLLFFLPILINLLLEFLGSEYTTCVD